MKKKIGLIMMVMLVGLPLVAACAKETPQTPTVEEPKGEIVIGMLEDLSGPLAATGADWVIGIQDCIRYINEEKGGVLGHQIRDILVDFKMEAPLAISGWERLKNENAVMITAGSATIVPLILNASQEDHIPILSFGGSTIEQIYPTEPSYFFGTFPHQRVVYESLGEMIEEDWKQRGQAGSPRVAFEVMSFGNMGKTWSKCTKLLVEDKGWEYTMTRSSLNPADVTTQVFQMKQFDPDYVFLANGEQAIIAFLKEFERQDLHPITYGTGNVGSRGVWDAVGELAVGVPFYSRTPQWWDTDVQGVALGRELTARWHPEVEWRGASYFHGFFSFAAVAEALERAIKEVGYENLNGEAMKAAWETIEDFEPLDSGMRYTWTPNDRRGILGCMWHQWTAEGTIELVHDWFIFGPMREDWKNDKFWLTD